MAKAKSIYSCSECGATSPKWQGQCPGCGLWNTLVETIAEVSATVNRYAGVGGLAGASAKLQQLSDIRPREEPRLSSGLEEFDRVLGGGCGNYYLGNRAPGTAIGAAANPFRGHVAALGTAVLRASFDHIADASCGI